MIVPELYTHLINTMTYTYRITTVGGTTLVGRGDTQAEAQLNAIAAADRFELGVKMPVIVAEAPKKEKQAWKA